MIEEKFCSNCKSFSSRFSVYCRRCGTKLDTVATVNGISLTDIEEDTK